MYITYKQSSILSTQTLSFNSEVNLDYPNEHGFTVFGRIPISFQETHYSRDFAMVKFAYLWSGRADPIFIINKKNQSRHQFLFEYCECLQ